uniref:Uncharacterized protein n=1 Tax=Populus trichocarpa TaxID=3694 RepID=B9GJJ9_POPTR
MLAHIHTRKEREKETWLIKAADRETSSISLPSRTSSSFTFSDRRILTPSSISTFLTCRKQPQQHQNMSAEQPIYTTKSAFCHDRKKQNLGINSYLLLAEKVPDLDSSVAVSDGSVDGKVSIHKPHLVSVPLGNPSNQVLHVAQGSPDSSTGLSCCKPGIDLQLSLPFLVFDHLPLGPSTSMILALILIFTPSGMSMVSDDRIVFMVCGSRLSNIFSL